EFGDVFGGVGRWHLIVNLVMCSECNLCHYKCQVSVTVSSLCYSVLKRTSVVLVSLCRSIVVDLCCPDHMESSVDSGINTVPIPTALANRAHNLLKLITCMRHDLTGSLHKGSGW